METVKFNTITDARIAFENSGVYEMFSGCEDDDIVRYLYRNSDGTTTMDDLIKQYIITTNRDVSEYFDPKNEKPEF